MAGALGCPPVICWTKWTFLKILWLLCNSGEIVAGTNSVRKIPKINHISGSGAGGAGVFPFTFLFFFFFCKLGI